MELGEGCQSVSTRARWRVGVIFQVVRAKWRGLV